MGFDVKWKHDGFNFEKSKTTVVFNLFLSIIALKIYSVYKLYGRLENIDETEGFLSNLKACILQIQMYDFYLVPLSFAFVTILS